MYMPAAPYQATAPLSATYAYPQYVASAIPATSWASVVSGDAPTQATTTISRKPNVSRFQPVTNVTSSTNPTGALPATIKTASSSSSGKQAWPPSLKAYFDRCFKECTTDVDRMHVTDTLQAKIAKVTADGRLSIHRWDLEPMVTIPSQAEKKKVIVSMPVWTAQPLPAPVSSSTATTKYSLQSLIMDEAGKKRKSRWEASSPIPDTASVASSFPSSPTKLWKEKAPVKKQKGGILEMAETLLLSEDEIAARKKRANRFVSEAESMALPVFAPLATGKDKKKDKNKKKGKSTDNYYGPTATDNSEFNLESLRIEGTCQRVEKDYLRLTSAPHPSTVRPEKVLRAALTNLINKWRNGSIEYISLCSQMKAVRQDLTVQHIQNGEHKIQLQIFTSCFFHVYTLFINFSIIHIYYADFTVEVYETHARMALQNGDLNEYNQCQTQLKNLYVRSLRGCEAEFTAYRILYYVYLLCNKKYTSGGSDLAFIMASLIGRNDLQRYGKYEIYLICVLVMYIVLLIL